MLRLLTTDGSLHKNVTFFYRLETLGGVVSFHLRRICLSTNVHLNSQFVSQLPKNEFLVRSLSAIPSISEYNAKKV
jgi:hypothetical protein